MKNNTLESYKKAIREKYEIEKLGEKSHFLLVLSRAKLRDLCFETFKENSSQADLNCFKAFLGFEFNSDCLNKLKVATDKFRPLETFLKGETDLTDLASVNMTAVLVDFMPRPYLKFCKVESKEMAVVEENFVANKMRSNSDISTQRISDVNRYDDRIVQPNPFFRKPIIAIGVVILCVMGLFGYQMWNQKECMQWDENHYEIVDCETEQAHFFQAFEKIPVNKTLLQLRKIDVSDTTIFFKHEKAQVWYCKKEKQIEYFNGPGFHPENGKVFKPITNYMIEKYVFNNLQDLNSKFENDSTSR